MWFTCGVASQCCYRVSSTSYLTCGNTMIIGGECCWCCYGPIARASQDRGCTMIIFCRGYLYYRAIPSFSSTSSTSSTVTYFTRQNTGTMIIR